MIRRPLIIATALAAMAIAVGCGDSEDSTEAISKAEYVKRADAICLKLNQDTSAKFQALNQRGNPPTIGEQRKMTRNVYLANLQSRLDQMRELPLPEQQEEEIIAFLKAHQKGIREATAKPAIAFFNTYETFAEANKLAEELGFKYCYEV